MSDVKYTEDGQEVVVVREVEGGYLVNHVYDYSHFSEDEGVEVSEQIVFYEKVYDKAPTFQLSEEIKELTQQKEEIEALITDLKETAWREKQMMSKMTNFPILSILYNYLTDNYTHLVNINTLQIYRRQGIFNTNNITVSSLGGEWSIRRHDGNYLSDSDSKVVVFQSEEEAVSYTKNRALDILKSQFNWQYATSANLKDCYQKFPDKLRADQEVKHFYESKFSELQTKENEKSKKLAEEELKKAQDKLAKLTQS